MTFSFYYPYYIPFFLIKKDNTINNFITFNHELAHGIYNASDNFYSTLQNHHFISELEGHFFEYLSTIFLEENHIVSYNVIKKLNYNKLIDIIALIVNFYFQYLGNLVFSERNEINIKHIKTKLLEQNLRFWIDKDLLKFYLKQDSNYLVTYIISFLISLDLENMAANDLEKAFYRFERIRYNKTNNIKHNLKSNGISFMSDGYKNLDNKIASLKLITNHA